jgi:hypothetical protein
MACTSGRIDAMPSKVASAETDKITERALATFGPGERETVVRALTAIRRNLTAADRLG